MRPRTRRTTTIRRMNASPPVGAYPQLRLCDHRGSAPTRARIRITINMLPSTSCSLYIYAVVWHQQSQSLYPLPRDADRKPDTGIAPVVQVVAVVNIGDVNVVVVIPVISPVFRPWVNKTDPIALILEAGESTNNHEGQAVDAEPMVATKVSTVMVVGDSVAVVAAPLLPVAVVRVPAL